MESQFNNRHKRSGNGGLVLTAPERDTLHTWGGHSGDAQTMCSQGEAGVGACLYWGSWVECFGFLAKARLLNSNQRSRILVSSMGVLPEGYTKKILGGGMLYQELSYAGDAAGC